MKNKELFLWANKTIEKLLIMQNCEYKTYRNFAKTNLITIRYLLYDSKSRKAFYNDREYSKLWLGITLNNIENYILHHVKKEFKIKNFGENND